ncbi:MAG: SIMPL domain-containing protein [Capsulimonadaceae bacterium]|nr:SIMPL domain-containing protein [Capsulimonadaceae bacterium]
MKRAFSAAMAAAISIVTLSIAGVAMGASVEGAPLSNAITVTGTGELKVKPDIAYATIQLVTLDRVQTTAVANNATKTQGVIEVLRRSQIADRDIETQWYTVEPSYDYRTTPAALVGYQASNTIKVTLRDVSKAGLILDKAVAAGATSVSGISFDMSDRSKNEGLALIEAIRNARAKADLVAGAAGVHVGRLLSVDESTPARPQPILFAARSADAAPGGATPTPIQTQELTVSASVVISYAIEYDRP